MADKQKLLFLFDVDGTLTPSRQKMTDEVREMLKSLRKDYYIGFVGGSNIEKQIEQVGDDCLTLFDYGFPENGLSFYKGEKLVTQKKFIDEIKENLYQEFVNFCLDYLSKVELPFKRGNFIEFRDSMVNISPCGRSCTNEERQRFFQYDNEHHVREAMVKVLKEKFEKHNLQFSIGGQISIDVFPKGWDKTYCLTHVKEEGINKIYFFGDKTSLGGNDYEIFTDQRVIGETVLDPSDTIKKVAEVVKTLKNE